MWESNPVFCLEGRRFIIMLHLAIVGKVGNDPTLLGLTDRRCTILASDPFADSIGFEPMYQILQTCA